MKYILMFAMILFTSISFGKSPSKEFMSKKIGIWAPALSEPEAKGYTLSEFAKNAFRNVVSQDWEDSSDSWILTVKVKDPMTKKRSTIKMQFLKSDKVAGPRRIVMDGEDYPMQNASPLMHSFIANIEEKLGGAKAESVKVEEKPEFVDRILGKYCQDNAKIEIKRVDSKNLGIKVTGAGCDIDKKLLIKKADSALVVTEFKPGCGINIEDSQFSGIRAKPTLRWECPDYKDSVAYFGCSPNVPAMPEPCQ